MLQFVFGKSAVASPNVEGFGTPPPTACNPAGILDLIHCHSLMPSALNSSATSPPPAELKGVPNDPSPADTAHPSLALVVLTQEVERVLPVCFLTTPLTSHPGDVCNTIWLKVLLEPGMALTCSRISISPLAGHVAGLGSLVHSAGHVAHPTGVWIISKSINDPMPYVFLDVRRTENRPVEAFGTESWVTEVSTLTIAVLDEA